MGNDSNNTLIPSVNNPTLLDRFLRFFSDIRPGESVTVLLMLSNIFLLLVCYYIIKTIREPLILLEGGAIGKSYSAAGQAMILMVFIPLYGWFFSRVSRFKMIIGVTLFFVINIELFSVAIGAKLPNIGVIFFIWVGFFSLTIIAQFWSYANDIYVKETGKRIFPIIAIGMTAGPLVGSLLAGHLFSIGIPPHLMLHISSILLLVSLACYVLANRREKPKVENELTGKPFKEGGNGFSLVFKSRYISLIALMFVLLNIVNTTGEFILGKLVTGRATMLLAQDAITSEGAYIGEFYGNYFLGVSIIAVILQAFAVSRIVKYGGLRWTLLILPFVALGAYGIIAAGAGFAMVRWSKTLENTTDYSIMNTARQLLWIPTSLEEKYKAKQAVDTFFVRMGDVLSAAYVFAGTTWLSLDVTGFAAGNIILVGIWIGIAFLILREYKRLKDDGTNVEQY